MDFDTSFFALFRQLFRQGTVREIGTSAFAVLCCIKSYVDFNDGKAFPSQAVIAQETGLSERQISRSLKILERHGLLTKEKKWKHYEYQLRERFNLDPATVVSWTHIPKTLKAARQELHDFLFTGQAKDAKIIHIEHLTIIHGDQVKGDKISISPEITDPALRTKLDSLRKKISPDKISPDTMSDEGTSHQT